MATNNAIDANDAGLIRYDGTGIFDSQTTTNHNLLIGAASNGITNVAPSATSGVPAISQGAAADPAFGTAVVAGGGTGATSFTAYSIIAAGTTSTGAFQNVSGVGTSGQVLTSAGAGALPTWQTASGGPGFATTKVTGTLTSAQIKALHGTPISVVAAQGANTVILPVYETGKLNYGGSNVFVAGASQTIGLYWDAASSPVLAISQVLSNAMIVASADQFKAQWFDNVTSTPAAITNKALYLYVSSATEISGNAANNNTIDYTVTYVVLTI
jgi:hypothetical protein